MRVCCFFGVTGVTGVTTLFYKSFFGLPKEKVRVTGVTKTDDRLTATPVFIRLCHFHAAGLVNQGEEIACVLACFLVGENSKKQYHFAFVII